jgi:probable O-glycosylation ligase (exosortase A-associated)
MSPDRLTFGSTLGFQFNFIIAIITILAWLFFKEPKKSPLNATTILLILFCLQISLSTITSLAPELAWPLWNRHIKTFVFIFLIIAIMRNKVRIHAFVWIIVLSLAFFGVRNGVYTIVSSGASHLAGPAGTIIGDNNHMALALVITLPLMNYLRLTTQNKYVRWILVAGMVFTTLGVLGSYSRDSLIGLVAVLGYSIIKLRRIGLAIMIVALLLPAISTMPAQWSARMDTISKADEDSSFNLRLETWKTQHLIAENRPLVGGGFSATQNPNVQFRYQPDINQGRAAHSIYFQVLGDHGFVGLFLFLLIGAVAWNNARKIERYSRNRPELSTAQTFASMAQLSLSGYFVAGAALSMA